jgi:hypothetical protein
MRPSLCDSRRASLLCLPVPCDYPCLIVGLLFVAIVIGRIYWPSALALIPACALVFLLVAYPKPSVGPAATTAKWLQFAVLRPELVRMAKVHNLGADSSLVVLTVDGFVPVGSRGFVYDSTGQVDQRSAERSEKWRSIAAKTVLGDGCEWTVRRLYGHYYSYFSSCQECPLRGILSPTDGPHLAESSY